MITLSRSGTYQLFETKHYHKILSLDDVVYAWVEAKSIGELLVMTHRAHKTDCLLATGDYHLYSVDEEPRLSDQLHLELEVGRGQWQGYLLLSGLPDDQKKRGRIIPTSEIITGHPTFRHKYRPGLV